MKKGMIIAFSLLAAVFVLPTGALAATNYYYVPTGSQYQPTAISAYTLGGGTQINEAQLIAYLQQLIVQLQAQLAARSNTTQYYVPGYYAPGYSYNYVVGQPQSGSNRNYYDDEPDVETISASSISRYDARLRGEVDMNDADDGEVFFVYGTDRNLIEDVEEDYDSYSDVDTRGERLRKVRVDSRLRGSEEYDYRISSLSSDTQYYFSLCVGYEDDRGRDTLTCGDTLRFRTNY